MADLMTNAAIVITSLSTIVLTVGKIKALRRKDPPPQKSPSCDYRHNALARRLDEESEKVAILEGRCDAHDRRANGMQRELTRLADLVEKEETG
jgi:hypothetical protein